VAPLQSSSREWPSGRQGTHHQVGLEDPEDRPLEVVLAQVADYVIDESRTDALLPALGSDEQGVDLAGGRIEIVIASDATVGKTDDLVSIDRDPWLAVGGLELEFGTPELLPAER
jgi:hypothetical protein